MCVIVARCGTPTGFASSVIDLTRGGIPMNRALPRAIIYNAFSVVSPREDGESLGAVRIWGFSSSWLSAWFGAFRVSWLSCSRLSPLDNPPAANVNRIVPVQPWRLSRPNAQGIRGGRISQAQESRPTEVFRPLVRLRACRERKQGLSGCSCLGHASRSPTGLPMSPSARGHVQRLAG